MQVEEQSIFKPLDDIPYGECFRTHPDSTFIFMKVRVEEGDDLYVDTRSGHAIELDENKVIPLITKLIVN